MKYTNIAVDLVDIERFNHWHLYNVSILNKVFDKLEIEYCLRNKFKSAERFAVRFAAKEALFKLVSSHFKYDISLFKFIKNVQIVSQPYPKYNISKTITDNLLFKDYNINLSLTHSKLSACAVAFIMFNKS